MGAVLAFPETWRYGADRFVLAGRAGTRITMRQGPDIWWPEWRRGEDVVKLSVWRAGPIPRSRFMSDDDRRHWNKEIGPVCSVFPPPEWSILVPERLAREVARDMASALRHFTRTFRCIDDQPRRLIPVEHVVFEGNLARFNGTKL